MQKRLLTKLAAIALLSLLLLIPLSLIEGQIAARGTRQATVIQEIATSSAGAQTLVGPMLMVRYRLRVERREKGGDHETVRQEIVERMQVVQARRLDIDGDLGVETLKRGIFRARLYHLGARLTGTAELPAGLGLGSEDARNLVDARAWLVVGIADPRGLTDEPELRVNGQTYRFATGTGGAIPGQGLHAYLGMVDTQHPQVFEISMPLSLAGMEQLAIAPTADTTTVALRSGWPHPSFQGRFLPAARQVGDAGFESRWRISHLARDLERILKAGSNGAGGETLGVALIDPVNVYLQSERAVKYGILFVTLTFAAFFITEILRRLPIHPLQYLLVGLALALFFLLLIALSEHVDFMIAYGISAFACVALIGSYLAGALGGRRRGMAFGAGIAALYGILYGVLLSEDNALLMGSLLLFVALAVAMLTTRRIDWYRIGDRLAAAAD